MKLRALAILGVLSVLPAAAPLLAHHSFAAEYDAKKPFEMKGTITKVDWMNPHVYFYIDVKEADGKTTNWAIELGNPAGLYRRGWKKEALKIGGTTKIEGSMSKDGSNRVNASTVTMDGKRLFAGSSGEEGYEGK